MPMAGKKEATPLQLEFIEWLVDPAREGSQAGFARTHDVSEKTLSWWKRGDIFFQKAWEARLAELNVEPDRIQKLINKLYDTALGGDVKAMQLYLQFVDKFTPKQQIVSGAVEAASMSDDELTTELEEGIRHLRAVPNG